MEDLKEISASICKVCFLLTILEELYPNINTVLKMFLTSPLMVATGEEVLAT